MDGDSSDTDDWGEGSPSPSSQHAELDREWQVRREAFFKTGYLEGLDAGKMETVQQGFDEGTCPAAWLCGQGPGRYGHEAAPGLRLAVRDALWAGLQFLCPS